MSVDTRSEEIEGLLETTDPMHKGEQIRAAVTRVMNKVDDRERLERVDLLTGALRLAIRKNAFFEKSIEASAVGGLQSSGVEWVDRPDEDLGGIWLNCRGDKSFS